MDTETVELPCAARTDKCNGSRKSVETHEETEKRADEDGESIPIYSDNGAHSRRRCCFTAGFLMRLTWASIPFVTGLCLVTLAYLLSKRGKVAGCPGSVRGRSLGVSKCENKIVFFTNKIHSLKQVPRLMGGYRIAVYRLGGQEALFYLKISRRTILNKLLTVSGKGNIWKATLDREKVIVKVSNYPDTSCLKAEFDWIQKVSTEMGRLVPKVHEHGTSKGYEFLIMEFIPGMDAFEYLKDAPFDQRLWFSVFRRIDQKVRMALTKLHKVNVCHGDPKPGNVMVTPGGEIRLIDFDAARICGTTGGFTGTEPGRRLELEGNGNQTDVWGKNDDIVHWLYLIKPVERFPLMYLASLSRSLESAEAVEHRRQLKEDMFVWMQIWTLGMVAAGERPGTYC